MGHIFGGNNTQQYNHMLYLSLCSHIYCYGEEKNHICAFYPYTNPLSYPVYLIVEEFYPNWYDFIYVLYICTSWQPLCHHQ